MSEVKVNNDGVVRAVDFGKGQPMTVAQRIRKNILTFDPLKMGDKETDDFLDGLRFLREQQRRLKRQDADFPFRQWHDEVESQKPYWAQIYGVTADNIDEYIATPDGIRRVVTSIKSNGIIPDLIVVEDEPPAHTAAEIHADLFGQADALLREAQDILARAEDESITARGRQAEEMARLGFRNVPSVKRDAARMHELEQDRLRTQAIAMFAREYPHNRFISQGTIESICRKYKLVCTEAMYFNGEIPEANMQAILNFRVTCMHVSPRSREYAKDIDGIELTDRIHGVNLYIIAPESQLERGAERGLIAGRMEQTRSFDPIVLQPVQYGFLVVTAWGDEAAEVANPNHN